MLVMVLFKSVIYPLMLDMVGLTMIETFTDKACLFKLHIVVFVNVGQSISSPERPTLIRESSYPHACTSKEVIPTRGLMCV